MVQENKKATENTGESTQTAEKMELKQEGADKFVLQPEFDSAFRNLPQATAPTTQPAIAVQATSPGENHFNARCLNVTLAMAEMLGRVSECMKLTVQHQMDSTLDVAAKAQSFYRQHTLQPQIICSTPQYPMQMQQMSPIPMQMQQQNYTPLTDQYPSAWEIN